MPRIMKHMSSICVRVMTKVVWLGALWPLEVISSPESNRRLCRLLCSTDRVMILYINENYGRFAGKNGLICLPIVNRDLDYYFIGLQYIESYDRY